MEEDTIFMRILKGEIPSDEVYSDDEFYAFRDINPAAPKHILLIPRKPIARIADATAKHTELLGRMLLVANEIASQEGLLESGYRLVINNGEGAGQSVFHLHLHIIGGRPLSWPPG